jgi:hypothetical protein
LSRIRLNGDFDARVGQEAPHTWSKTRRKFPTNVPPDLIVAEASLDEYARMRVT